VRSRQSSREGWTSSARTEPDGAVSRPKPTQPKKPVATGGAAASATNGTLNGSANGTPIAATMNQSRGEPSRGATTPTGGVKMRRSAPPKASPSLSRQTAQNGTTGVSQQSRTQTTPTPKSQPKPKTDTSKKVKQQTNGPEQQEEQQQQQQKAKTVSKPSPKASKKQPVSSAVANSSTSAFSSDGSPAVSLVIDDTVGQLIDLEIEEPTNEAPPSDVADQGSKTSTPREKRPISGNEPSPTGSESGLQSRLDFNSLNLKKAKTRASGDFPDAALSHDSFSTDGIKSKLDFNSLNLKKAHTRVGGVAVDIAATDDAQLTTAHAKAGSSEIVVEEHSVADLLTKFKEKDQEGSSLVPPTLVEAKPAEPTKPVEPTRPTEPTRPSEPTVAVQPIPTIQSLKHPSQTSVASSSVTSFTSDLTGEVETDTDKDTIKSEIDGEDRKKVTFNDDVEKIVEIEIPVENGEKEKRKKEKKSKKKEKKEKESDESKKEKKKARKKEKQEDKKRQQMIESWVNSQNQEDKEQVASTPTPPPGVGCTNEVSTQGAEGEEIEDYKARLRRQKEEFRLKKAREAEEAREREEKEIEMQREREAQAEKARQEREATLAQEREQRLQATSVEDKPLVMDENMTSMQQRMSENLSKADQEREQKRKEEEEQRLARKERIRIIMERTRKTDMERDSSFPSSSDINERISQIGAGRSGVGEGAEVDGLSSRAQTLLAPLRSAASDQTASNEVNTVRSVQ
jgi:hypothetical protein